MAATTSRMEGIEYRKKSAYGDTVEEDRYKWPDGVKVGDVVTLLSSFDATVLVSGKGHEVPLSYLRGKVVGLYFYPCHSKTFVFRELSKMYKELRDSGVNFELVFIWVCPVGIQPIEFPNYQLRRNWEERFEKHFQKCFEGETWLALRFSQTEDSRSFLAWSEMLSDNEEHSELVIIQPNGNLAYPYSMDIYREFGIEAYPFSKSRFAEIVFGRLKSWTLDSVLSFGDHIVFDQNKLRIPASCLFGKKILLFLDPCYPDELVYKKVSAWYKEIKQKDENFEMIRWCYQYDYPRREAAGKMPREEAGNEKNPWLELLYPMDRFLCMNAFLNYTAIGEKLTAGFPMFVAFGRDGRFKTMTSLIELIFYDGKDNNQTPDFFDNVHLYQQVCYYVALAKNWCRDSLQC